MSQVNIGPYCDGRVAQTCIQYCGLYAGIEFPEAGYEAGDWVLYNTLASGRVVEGESYWCEVGIYRNGYGAEFLFTHYGYPGRSGSATQLHQLDRTRHIVETSEGPMVFLLLHRTSVIENSGIWAAYVWDRVLGAWVELREEYIPELNQGDIRAQFEFIPLESGISWPGLPRIDWVELQRCSTDGWLYWTPTSVPNSEFVVTSGNPYDYRVINQYYRWYAGGNNPSGTDPKGSDYREINHGNPVVVEAPEKIRIVKTELIPSAIGMIPRPITFKDKKVEILNPLR